MLFVFVTRTGAPKPVLQLLLKDAAAVAQYDDDSDELPAITATPTSATAAAATALTQASVCPHCNRQFASAHTATRHAAVCMSVFGGAGKKR